MSCHMGKERILPLFNFLLGRNKQLCIDLPQAQDAPLVRTCDVVTSGKSVKGALKTFVTWTYKINKKQARSQGLVAPLQLAPGNSRQDCYGQAVFSEKRGWMCILSSPFLGCVTLGTLPDGGASSSVRRWGWWCDSWPRPTWSICADPVAVALHVLMHFILSAAPWRLKGCA